MFNIYVLNRHDFYVSNRNREFKDDNEFKIFSEYKYISEYKYNYKTCFIAHVVSFIYMSISKTFIYSLAINYEKFNIFTAFF